MWHVHKLHQLYTSLSILIFFLVNCGDPLPPSNGSVGNYVHTREGATAHFSCHDGLNPSSIIISTCIDTGLWFPPPEEHSCTFLIGKLLCESYTLLLSNIATVNITSLQRNISRAEMNCPGDIISYQCSIFTNSEFPSLTWTVTLPGKMPLMITYNKNHTLHNVNVNSLMNFITSTLVAFTNDTFINSVLEVKLQENISAHQTQLQCSMQNLSVADTTVYTNTQGITIGIGWVRAGDSYRV